MTGSKMTLRKQALAAMKTPPPEGYYVWDGKDEDERPATHEEMQAAREQYRRKAGRPAGSGTKVSTTIRFDHEVLAAFKASGPGWQTRMNDALKDWLRTHKPA